MSSVKFDSTTKVASLYRAFPGAWPLLQSLGISADSDWNLTLSGLADQRNLDLDELIRALENLAGDEESASK